MVRPPGGPGWNLALGGGWLALSAADGDPMKAWWWMLAVGGLWLVGCQNSGQTSADPWARAAEAVDQSSPQAAEAVKTLWSTDLSTEDRARYHFLQGELWYQQAKGQDTAALAKAEQSFLRVLDLIEPGEWADRTRYNLALVRQKLDPASPKGASGQNSPEDQPNQQSGTSPQSAQNQKSGQSGNQTGQNSPPQSPNPAERRPGSPGQTGTDPPSDAAGQKGQAESAAGSKQSAQQAAAAAKAAALQPKDLSQAVKPRADTAEAALMEALKNDQKRQAEKSLLLQGGVSPVEKDW